MCNDCGPQELALELKRLKTPGISLTFGGMGGEVEHINILLSIGLWALASNM